MIDNAPHLQKNIIENQSLVVCFLYDIKFDENMLTIIVILDRM